MDSSMDRVKKLLQSPGSKRKNGHSGGGSKGPSAKPLPQGGKGALPPGKGYFGVALEELRKRENKDIPKLITKVAEYIYDNGKLLNIYYTQTYHQSSIICLR